MSLVNNVDLIQNDKEKEILALSNTIASQCLTLKKIDIIE